MAAHCCKPVRTAPTSSIGSKKCRLSDAGRRVIQHGLDAQLPQIMQRWPLATRVQETLSQAGGHLSIFDLTWRLVEPEVQALLAEQETGQAVNSGNAAPARGELKLALDLLARLGVIEWRAGGQAVALVQDAALHVER
jgi:hypothetical protein